MIRRILFLAVALALLLNVRANVQQPLQPWRPTPFQPKVVSKGGVRPLIQTSALRKELVRASDKKAKDRLKQRVEAARELAKRLEQTTEASLTRGGTLRQTMVDAKVEAYKVDSTMKGLNEAVSKMREAGRAINSELDKVEGVK